MSAEASEKFGCLLSVVDASLCAVELKTEDAKYETAAEIVKN